MVLLNPQTSDNTGRKCHVFMCFIEGDTEVKEDGSRSEASLLHEAQPVGETTGHLVHVKMSPHPRLQDPDKYEDVQAEILYEKIKYLFGRT